MYKTKLNKIGNLIDSIKNDINLPIVSDFLEWFYEKINLNFSKETPKLSLSKGDIFFINLGKNIGSELNKTRPCLIISKGLFNNLNTVVIIPLKSYKGKLNRSTQIIVDNKLLKKKSIIDCLSIRQIDKKRINNYVGKLKYDDLILVEKKLLKIFGIKNNE